MIALITGGSSGLGFQLARLFARDGNVLLLVSENDDQLKNAGDNLKSEFPSVKIHTLCCDLSRASAATEVHKWSKQFGNVDALVNNAGFGTFGYLNDIAEEKEHAMLQLNIMSFYFLTRMFLADMEKTDGGRILNISSNTALQPVPLMSAYAATKSFVRHFSQSLHRELKSKNSNVTVTVVCPPAIHNTAFKDRAEMSDVRTFSSFLSATAEEVAKDAYEGMMKGKELVIAGKVLRNTRWLNKLLPEFIVSKILWRELKRKSSQ
jgi:short-subunit dehydrogenase